MLLKASEWKKDGEKEGDADREREREREAEKETAKSVIGRKLAEDKSSHTNPPWKTDGGKSTDSR